MRNKGRGIHTEDAKRAEPTRRPYRMKLLEEVRDGRLQSFARAGVHEITQVTYRNCHNSHRVDHLATAWRRLHTRITKLATNAAVLPSLPNRQHL
jgi:hypothetical protein